MMNSEISILRFLRKQHPYWNNHKIKNAYKKVMGKYPKSKIPTKKEKWVIKK